MASQKMSGGAYDYESAYTTHDDDDEEHKILFADKLKKRTFAETSVLSIQLRSKNTAHLELLHEGIDNREVHFTEAQFSGVLDFFVRSGTKWSEQQQNTSIFLVACASPKIQLDGLVEGPEKVYKEAGEKLTVALGGKEATFLSSDTRRAVQAAFYLQSVLGKKSPIHLFPCIHHLGPGQRDGDMSTWKGFMQPLNRSLYREALKMKKNKEVALSELVAAINTTIDEVNASFYDSKYEASMFHCRNTNFFDLLAEFQATSLAKIPATLSAQFQATPSGGGTKRSRRTKRQNKNKSKRKRRYFTRNTRS